MHVDWLRDKSAYDDYKRSIKAVYNYYMNIALAPKF